MEEEERMDGNKRHNNRNVVRVNYWGKLKRRTEKKIFYQLVSCPHALPGCWECSRDFQPPGVAVDRTVHDAGGGAVVEVPGEFAQI